MATVYCLAHLSVSTVADLRIPCVLSAPLANLQEAIEEMLRVVDVNRDGEVEYQEFIPMLNKIQGP